MEVVTANLAKPGRWLSEDIVGHWGSHFWLFDGATPPTVHNGAQATQEFLQELNLQMHTAARGSPEAPPVELLRRAIRDTRNALPHLAAARYLPHATAAIVKIEPHKIQYAVLGDVCLVINVGSDRLVISDDRLQHVARRERDAVRSLREAGVPEGSAQYLAARDELIASEQKSMNVENGYWVVALDPAAASEALVGERQVGAGGAAEVLAASDGFARLVTHFSIVSELHELPRLIIERGAASLLKSLRELERNKSAFKRRASSTHDDASFLLVRWSPTPAA